MRQYIINIFIFIVMIGILMFGVRSMQQGTQDYSQESLEKALKRGIVQCYALEGRYPDTLEYLLENYHIVYDETYFDVKYEVMASNLMPQITVIARK